MTVIAQGGNRNRARSSWMNNGIMKRLVILSTLRDWNWFNVSRHFTRQRDPESQGSRMKGMYGRMSSLNHVSFGGRGLHNQLHCLRCCAVLCCAVLIHVLKSPPISKTKKNKRSTHLRTCQHRLIKLILYVKLCGAWPPPRSVAPKEQRHQCSRCARRLYPNGKRKKEKRWERGAVDTEGQHDRIDECGFVLVKATSIQRIPFKTMRWW